MKVPRAANALNYLDDDLISDAIEYQPKQHRFFRWTKWKTVAACLALLAVVMGIFPMFNQPTISPFVLTAYALEGDNGISASTMREGDSVPVSLFESKNGLQGFVFSFAYGGELDPSSISIIPENKYFEHLDEIVGLPGENGRHYFYFIPEQAETAPYSVTLSYTNKDIDSIYEFNISIDKAENGYNAVIESINTYKKQV